MKIYTKTGDNGETSLIYGQRIQKDALRVEAYGMIDHVNSLLGLCVAELRIMPEQIVEIIDVLETIQRDLFDVGRDLATPIDKMGDGYVLSKQVDYLEQKIDQLDGTVAPLTQFILPGGTVAASTLHVARTAVRTAERQLVALARQEPVHAEVRKYVNRLSDLLFVAARVVNARGGVNERGVTF